MIRRRRARRRAAAGAIFFACMLAAVAIGGYLWLQSRHDLEASVQNNGTNGASGADKWTSRLGQFLAGGPTGGTWQTQFLSCVYTNYIAPHPKRDEIYLIAQVDAGKPKEPIAVSRWLIARHFFRAPAHLFFSNYVRSDGPIREEIDDGTKTWRVHWAPRLNSDGLTERIVWFTEVGREVVQIEDRARTGHLIRQVRRISKKTGVWDPKDVVEKPHTHLEKAPPNPPANPEQGLQEVVRKAPFRVYAPSYLPAGFVLVRASYSVCDAGRAPAGAKNKDGAENPVHLVSLLYSDGLGLISVGIAPRSDMNAIELLVMETMAPNACPGLPANPRDIRDNDTVIRMRTDTCRTVLRRDDLEDVSVTIIGRNEIPGDEYLHMIGSLEPVEPSKPK